MFALLDNSSPMTGLFSFLFLARRAEALLFREATAIPAVTVPSFFRKEFSPPLPLLERSDARLRDEEGLPFFVRRGEKQIFFSPTAPDIVQQYRCRFFRTEKTLSPLPLFPFHIIARQDLDPASDAGRAFFPAAPLFFLQVHACNAPPSPPFSVANNTYWDALIVVRHSFLPLFCVARNILSSPLFFFPSPPAPRTRMEVARPRLSLSSIFFR